MLPHQNKEYICNCVSQGLVWIVPFFLWEIFTSCCEFTCDVEAGGQIYGGGWKGDLGAGTMDSEADNPEYLQHHGQKVLKWNKREGRTKVASGTGIWKSIWNLWSWFPQTQRIEANTVLVKGEKSPLFANTKQVTADLQFQTCCISSRGPIAGQELDPSGPFITSNPTLAQLTNGLW